MGPPYGSRLMPVVVDEIAKEQPDHAYAFTPITANVSDGFKPVTFFEVATAVNALAQWIHTEIGPSSQFDTIAYMGLSDLRYVAVFLAAVKCGYKVLLPSLRNSAWMNASLLEQTKCSNVLYAPEVETIVEPLLKEREDLRAHKILPLEDLIRSGAKHYPYEKEYEEAKWDPILILHSSGSTGNPKPIHMNHATFAVGDNDRNLPSVPGRVNQNWALWDFPAKENFFSAFPAFHLAGFSSMVMLPIYYSNATLVLAPPNRPPTGNMLSEIMDQLTLKSIFCPPIIAEQLVQEPNGVEKCKDLKFLLYAGGPLSKAAGSALSSVTDVCQFYGQTETGAIQALVPKREDWASLEWHPTQEAIMEPSIDGTYEMVIKRNPALVGIRSISCNFPNVEIWRTRDLFHQHPTKPNLWTFHGRTDDIIVLSNGEKFNPSPSETHIAAHPLLNGAMISGQGYPQPSLILEPKDHGIDPQALIDKLWPTIEEANAQAPGHGRVTRNMTICSSPSKPFDRAAKGTVIRSTTVKKFEAEIAQLYTDNSNNYGRAIELGTSPDLETATKFVKEVVSYAFPSHDITEEDDLFSRGLDSLQTTEIISLLKSGIRSGNPDKDISCISTRIVYENPSIKVLANAVLAHLNSTGASSTPGGGAALSRVQKMERMVDKYTHNLPPPQEHENSESSGVHVILTGSTGTLGTQILVKLLSDPEVASILCLDRSADAKERIMRSLASWSPPPAIDTSRVSFDQADYGKAGWGLSPSLTSKLRDNTSVIIHNAWKVDFNHSLDSFETVHVQGVRNLVDFATKCSSRPRIVFISSVSTVINWGATAGAGTLASSATDTIPELLPPSPATAQELGYAESKAVAERILTSAAAASNIDASIVRIGQIAGPIGPGNSATWNTHEWFPLLLKTSAALGKVPDGAALGQIDWVPSDVVASAIWEIATSAANTAVDGSPLRVFHIVNPKRRPWGELLPGVRARLGADTVGAVTMGEWVGELEKVDTQDKEAVMAKPAVKILGYFREMVGGGYLGAENVVFSTEKARECSRSLAHVGPVRDEWMEKWMADLGF
ncbi:putative NRPS-like protein biosynthetic cluster [Diatrype stigma]|uniref:NRPS-like protein biosynthetic cluster n=1 Tax=Diatrype stigma TaxID=117547 RepID=A0AAN9U9A0_9PEZI